MLQRLPPSERRQCDGVDAGGANCTFEAQYRLTEENGAQYYFCSEHAKKVAKSYTENGYKISLDEKMSAEERRRE
jgi:YHS domain-containing protein